MDQDPLEILEELYKRVREKLREYEWSLFDSNPSKENRLAFAPDRSSSQSFHDYASLIVLAMSLQNLLEPDDESPG